MRILMPGGYGQTGRPLVRHLLRVTEHELIIAGRHLSKAQAFAERLCSARVQTMELDGRDARALRRALDGVDLLVLLCPTSDTTVATVAAALDARTDWLDLQLSDHKLRVLKANESQIRDRGCCFTTEAGFHPGLPAALVRFAGSRLAHLDTATVACFMNIHGRLPYTDTVDELTQFLLDYRAQVYKSGKWTKAGTYTTHQFDFGPGVGKRACYSMFLEELEILPRLFPDLQDTGLYIASTGWLLDALTVPIMLLLKIAPRAAFRPMGRLLWWAMTSVSPPPYRIVLQVEAAGSDADGHRSFRTQLQHEDGYEFTAIPVAAFLQQFGQIRCPGLHLMGHLCDPQRLVADMQRMGIILTQTEI